MALVSNGSFNNGIKMGKNYNYGGLIEIEKIMSFSGKWMQLQIAMLNKIHQPAPPKKQYHKLSFVDPKFYKDTYNHIYIHSMKVDIKREREVRGQTEGGEHGG